MTKLTKKELFLIIISFFIGILICFLINILIIYEINSPINNSSLSNSISKVYDSVVVIEVYNGTNLESTGTGFFYKKDARYAYIITNEHVLSGNTIEVTNTNDLKTEAEVLGKDEYLDIAILRVKKKYAKKIANLGNSDKTKIGDQIYTIGAPLGINYKGTVTSGIISGKDRTVQTTVGDTNNSNWLMKVIQIDASINKGNSGGPLLNTKGEVIGICTLKLTDEEIEGMGFAIPINDVRKNISKIEKGKDINWPELGISMTDVTNSSMLATNNISNPTHEKEGIVVLSVKENSSAEKAKLKKGDIIISLGNKKIKNISYLKYELFQHKVGEKIKIEYIRNGNKKTTYTKLYSSN